MPRRPSNHFIDGIKLGGQALTDSNGTAKYLAIGAIFIRNRAGLPLFQNRCSKKFKPVGIFALNHGHEFLAAVSPEDIGLSFEYLPHDVRLLSNSLITLLVAVVVIELLEMIKIHHKYSESLIGAPLPGKQTPGFTHQCPAIEEIGQFIDGAQANQLLVGLLKLPQQSINPVPADHTDKQ